MVPPHPIRTLWTKPDPWWTCRKSQSLQSSTRELIRTCLSASCAGRCWTRRFQASSSPSGFFTSLLYLDFVGVRSQFFQIHVSRSLPKNCPACLLGFEVSCSKGDWRCDCKVSRVWLGVFGCANGGMAVGWFSVQGHQIVHSAISVWRSPLSSNASLGCAFKTCKNYILGLGHVCKRVLVCIYIGVLVTITVSERFGGKTVFAMCLRLLI